MTEPNRMRVVTEPMDPAVAEKVYQALSDGPTIRESALEIEEVDRDD